MADIYEANGCKFYAQHDMIVAWERKERRKFEPVTTEFLLSAPDGPFVDVGASTGWFSCLMAKTRDVYAFEPLPTSQKRLRENAELNGVTLNIYDGAASDRTGKAVLNFNAGLPLTSGASIEPEACLCPTGRLEVLTWRLDDVIEFDPAVIKIDVEGHELAVLRGAEDVIERARPWMVLEANTDAHEAALAAWLADHGYTYTKADERNLLCVS